MGAGTGDGDKGRHRRFEVGSEKAPVLTATHGQSCSQSLSMAPLGMLLAMVGGLSWTTDNAWLPSSPPPPTPQCSQNPAPVLWSPHVPTTSPLLLPRRFHAPAPRDRGGVSCSNDFISKFTFTATV